VSTGLVQARRHGKPRVLLFGGDGGDRNLGDQAMLINTVVRIRRFLPEASITVMAGKPERLPDLADVRRVQWPEASAGGSKQPNRSLRIPGLWRLWRLPALMQGVSLVRAARRRRHTGLLPADPSKGAAELLTLIQDADLVVNYGSGGLNDIWARSVVYPWSFCYLAAHALGKRVMVTGQGIGPLSHFLDRWLLCTALNRVDLITVRDCHDSMELLHRGRVRTPLLRIAADDALSLDPAPQVIARKTLEEEGVPASRPLVAMQFRDTAFDREVGQQDRTLMAAIADHLVEKMGAHIVFVSTVYNEVHRVDDRAAAQSVVSQMRHAEHATVLQGVYDPPTVKSLIAEADLAIGTSYHFQIFGLATQRPTIGLYKGRYYRQKAHGLFGHFGRTDSIFDLERCSAEEVLRQALMAMEDREQLAKSGEVVIRQMNEALDATWSHVAGWFAADGAKHQVPAVPTSVPTVVTR
jgi:polysaccharide pyruvyl transferase WcaK-like protein